MPCDTDIGCPSVIERAPGIECYLNTANQSSQLYQADNLTVRLSPHPNFIIEINALVRRYRRLAEYFASFVWPSHDRRGFDMARESPNSCARTNASTPKGLSRKQLGTSRSCGQVLPDHTIPTVTGADDRSPRRRRKRRPDRLAKARRHPLVASRQDALWVEERHP